MPSSPRYKLQPWTPPETETHEAVATMLAKLVLTPPVAWNCFPAGHIELDGKQGAKLQRMGLKPGWPDFQLFYRGQPFGIELKRPGQGLSRGGFVRTRVHGQMRWRAGQVEVFAELEAAGWRLAICHDVVGVRDQLVAWGIPLRGHSL
jgi:hypothetical protein